MNNVYANKIITTLPVSVTVQYQRVDLQNAGYQRSQSVANVQHAKFSQYHEATNSTVPRKNTRLRHHAEESAKHDEIIVVMREANSTML